MAESRNGVSVLFLVYVFIVVLRACVCGGVTFRGIRFAIRDNGDLFRVCIMNWRLIRVSLLQCGRDWVFYIRSKPPDGADDSMFYVRSYFWVLGWRFDIKIWQRPLGCVSLCVCDVIWRGLIYRQSCGLDLVYLLQRWIVWPTELDKGETKPKYIPSCVWHLVSRGFGSIFILQKCTLYLLSTIKLVLIQTKIITMHVPRWNAVVSQIILNLLESNNADIIHTKLLVLNWLYRISLCCAKRENT